MNLVDAGSQTLRLYGNNSGFTGNFSEPSNTRGMMWSDNVGAGNAAITGSAAASWDLSGTFGVIETAGAATPTVQLGSLSGSNSATYLGAFSGSGIKTLQVGALNTSISFAGSMVDNPLGGGTPVLRLHKSGKYRHLDLERYEYLFRPNDGECRRSRFYYRRTIVCHLEYRRQRHQAAPMSAASGLITLPASPNMSGKNRQHIVPTGTSTGSTWNAVTWAGTATGVLRRWEAQRIDGDERCSQGASETDGDIHYHESGGKSHPMKINFTLGKTVCILPTPGGHAAVPGVPQGSITPSGAAGHWQQWWISSRPPIGPNNGSFYA